MYTGHGTLYVIVNDDENGEPFEVFGVLGKSGGCDSAQIEAIARLISLLLRSGVGVDEVVRQLKGITCCPKWDRGVLVQSVPDAIAQVLEGEATDVPITKSVIIETPWFDTALPIVTRTELAGPVEVVDTHQVFAGGRCPECSGPTIMQEGCRTCHGCGWSKCA